MNYLAHLYLAGDDPDERFGSLLGDFVKGRPEQAYDGAVLLGILLHRRVDSFTDAHPVFARSRARVEPGLRRFAGVLVDLFFDHFLARDWASLHPTPLECYARDIYRMVTRREAEMPASMVPAMRYMVAYDSLHAYRDRRHVARALGGIGRRLKRPVPLEQGVRDLERREADFQADFRDFFPQLQAFARAERERLLETLGL